MPQLYIDIFMPQASHLYNSFNKKRIEFFNSTNSKDTVVKESLEYDSASEIINVIWNYEHNRKIYQTFNFRISSLFFHKVSSIFLFKFKKLLNVFKIIKEDPSKNKNK